MQRRQFATVVVSAAFLASFCGLFAADFAAAAEPAAKSVKLTIDYGDGVQKTFKAIDWKQGMTVFDALQAAAKHPRGIKVSHRGSGSLVLITAIDGQANEGNGRNWIYEVNGKSGEVGAGAAELKAGDAVLWWFGEYQ
jgi:hypothetical protein